MKILQSWWGKEKEVTGATMRETPSPKLHHRLNSLQLLNARLGLLTKPRAASLAHGWRGLLTAFIAKDCHREAE
jgi:hypothetical protein